MRGNGRGSAVFQFLARATPIISIYCKVKIPSLTHVTAISAVEDAVLHGRFSEIIISNPKREIRLGCDRNFDELILSVGRNKRRKKLFSIFKGAGRVEWMWIMTNQQGYFDGFRIQMSAQGCERVFEFMSIGSCIEVYEANMKPSHSFAPIRYERGSSKMLTKI